MKRWLPTLLILAACSQQGLPVRTSGSTPQPEPGPVRTAEPSPTATPTPAPSPTAVPAGWLIFGDSITQNSFHDRVAWDAAWGPGAPELLGIGLRGADSAYALTQEDEILGQRPGPGGMGLAFGTNDVGHKRTPEAFKASLKAMYDKAVMVGKRPLVATIPYSPHQDYQAVPAFNQAIAELKLPAGPDLYAWFAQHPEQISPDGIHPTDEGNAHVQRLWAEAAKASGF